MFDYQILNLTADFFNDYPTQNYNELLKKDYRPYNCLLFQTHYDYFICVPFRSHINHNYAFKFRKSQRSKSKKSGLDYTKIIIINNNKYIGTQDALIDHDEYIETRTFINRIQKEVLEYVESYINYKQNIKTISEREFKRRYDYSTLKYFHTELGI